MPQTPNLLIIISDEHRKDTMGCVGHPIVKTPNLDALAARGTLFENAYTPSPMCVPTRAAIATGRHVHQTGNWDSATPYTGAPDSWMHHLRNSGIPVTSIGKLHFRSPEDDNGFAQEIIPMHVVGGVGWTVGLLRKNAPDYDAAAELAQDVGLGSSTYTDYDLAITAAAEDWLAKQTPDQPWAAFVSLVSPHYPLTAPQEYYDMYPPKEMDLPIGFGTKPDHSELANIAEFFDYDRYFDEEKTREAKAAYYGLTSFMDNCVGRVLSALDTSGMADNTIVIYVSDHGDMMGDQGFWTKQVMFDASAGVPMIAAGPGIPVGRCKTGTSLLDLAPTVCEAAGLEIPEFCGASLRTIANAPENPERTVFSEYHDGGSTTGTFMVRWQNWKFVYYVDHAPQLFDLETDPQELRDLAVNDAEPGITAALTEGERRLREICDPEAVNEQCFAEQAKRIEYLGGEEACLNAYVFNHTPTPDEQADMSEGSAL